MDSRRTIGIPSQWFAPTAEPQTARWQGSVEDATRNSRRQFSDEEQACRHGSYTIVNILSLMKYFDVSYMADFEARLVTKKRDFAGDRGDIASHRGVQRARRC